MLGSSESTSKQASPKEVCFRNKSWTLCDQDQNKTITTRRKIQLSCSTSVVKSLSQSRIPKWSRTCWVQKHHLRQDWHNHERHEQAHGRVFPLFPRRRSLESKACAHAFYKELLLHMIKVLKDKLEESIKDWAQHI